MAGKATGSSADAQSDDAPKRAINRAAIMGFIAGAPGQTSRVDSAQN
jgi:hypothetical protein